MLHHNDSLLRIPLRGWRPPEILAEQLFGRCDVAPVFGVACCISVSHVARPIAKSSTEALTGRMLILKCAAVLSEVLHDFRRDGALIGRVAASNRVYEPIRVRAKWSLSTTELKEWSPFADFHSYILQ
jgi:hypothetical protein